MRLKMKKKERTEYGIFSFLKAHFTPFQFYEVPTLVLVFTNQKKSEEDFDICGKKGKKQN